MWRAFRAVVGGDGKRTPVSEMIVSRLSNNLEVPDYKFFAIGYLPSQYPMIVSRVPRISGENA
jgi:hypothetical protein